MTRVLLTIALAVGLFTIAAPLPADSGDDGARSLYDQAQGMKRSGQIAQARATFETLAAQPDGGTWTTLAADELRFGLPLHESNLLLSRLAAASDSATRSRLLGQIEALYVSMINDNTDKPERIAEIERRRDQLALMGQAHSRDDSANLKNGLARLRNQIDSDHRSSGRWPDRRHLEAAVSGMLSAAGLPPDRLSLFEYYPTSNSFYATLRDSRGGSDIKIKADGNGVRIEGGGL